MYFIFSTAVMESYVLGNLSDIDQDILSNSAQRKHLSSSNLPWGLVLSGGPVSNKVLSRTLAAFPAVAFGIFSVTAFTPIAAAQQSAQPAAGGPVTSDLPIHARKPANKGADITFKDGRLSINNQRLSLQHLASEISNKAGVPVILDGAVANESVSISFHDLPLDEGLRQVFKDNDAFFFYGSDKGEPAALKVVWVYLKGRARGIEPVPPEKWASTKELEKMLTAPDPMVRGHAVKAIVEREGGKALDAVAKALKDADDGVRADALYGATNAGLELPMNSLRELALNDASADVRFLALQSMANNVDAKSVAEEALNDPSEPVRLKAQEILQLLHKQSPEPTQPLQGQPQPSNQ